VVVTAWVSSPQLTTDWRKHLALGDFIRVALGVAACLWMLVNLFILPKDARGYRTWIYIGLALTPLIVLGILAFWWHETER
jgi:hypothetical protein